MASRFRDHPIGVALEGIDLLLDVELPGRMQRIVAGVVVTAALVATVAARARHLQVRLRVGMVLELLEDVETVDIGEMDVQDDDVRLLLPGGLEPLGAVDGGLDGKILYGRSGRN